MTNTFSIALTSMEAATKRVAVAATNIANMRSLAAADSDDTEGFRPLEVDQVSLADGGTRAVTREVDPPSVPSFEPNHPDANADGVVPRPNIAPERQFVELMLATRAFQGSLIAISTQNQMLGALLDRRA